MSKMDDLRAMREARYEQMTARASKPPAASTMAAAPTPKPVAAGPVADTDADTDEDTDEDTDGDTRESLCGHRAISGRTCTREQGHAAKSHRYS